MLRASRNLFLDTTMAFAGGLARGVTAAQIEAACGQVVYGTDYPNIPYEYGRELAQLEALGLSSAALRAILRENARRLSPALDA
jgi:predicted TIM-barrel fold metal-dependent hydrolase